MAIMKYLFHLVTLWLDSKGLGCFSRIKGFVEELRDLTQLTCSEGLKSEVFLLKYKHLISCTCNKNPHI